MVIYADVLIVTNMAVNYFLLLAAAKLSRQRISLARLLLGAFLGSFTSLYILVPQPGLALDILSRPLFALLTVTAAFAPKKKRVFLRLFVIFLGITLLFGGAMLAINTVLKPAGMAVIGSVVYFDISPVLLVTTTALCYGLLRLGELFARLRDPHAKRQTVILNFEEISLPTEAMIDTGHSLFDPFSGDPVVLISPKAAETLLPLGIAAAKAQGKFRLIPYKTAAETGTLEGFRISLGKGGQLRAVAAVSRNIGGDDFDAVIDPETAEKLRCGKGEKNEENNT